jgi:nucleotide-binding universal stress UspA family protein
MGAMREAREMRLKIVVPTDFSDCARAAVDRALEIARLFPAEIVLVHVVEVPMSAADWNLAADVDLLAARFRRIARERLAALAESADPTRQRIVRADVVDGSPAQGIVDFASAEGAALIAIGSHGRTGVRRLLLGSIAERVVRLAGCDVLVVHRK